MTPKNHKLYLVILLFHFYPSTGFSLDSDKEKPLEITADIVTINHRSGLTTYEGHVKVIQGTTQLIADRLSTQVNKAGKLTEAIAQGKQTIYRTIPEEKKPEFIAQANTIKYYPLQNKVILIGNAQASQRHNVFKAPQIEYNVKQQTLVTPRLSKGVTRIILQPTKEHF